MRLLRDDLERRAAAGSVLRGDGGGNCSAAGSAHAIAGFGGLNK